MRVENPSDELVGTVAGGYAVLSRVGSGSMGHVYEAQHMAQGFRVALKVLHKHHQEELAARFLREGKTLQLLNHPNIVQLVDMGQLDNGSLFLATELIAGDSLRVVMDRGPIQPKRALHIVRQMLDALEAAHELGVVHRDIKPENIMIAPGDVVKVLDFGVAKLLADTVAGLGEANLTSVGFSIFGSALYIAPESVVGQPVDARIDLYSTGAMLYEMLTGKPPYDDEDPTELLKKQAFAPVPKLSDAAPARRFTPEIEYLVTEAMQKRPEDRFPSARVMLEAVDAAIRSLSPAPPPVPKKDPHAALMRPVMKPSAERTEPTRVPARTALSRNVLLLVGGCAATMVAAVVIVLLLSRGGDSSAAPRGDSELATRGKALITAGDPKHAIEVIEADPGHVGDPSANLVLGHARFAAGRRREALGAYERALRLSPHVKGDKDLRTNLTATLEGKDTIAVIVALELLASVAPDLVTAYASTGKLADARQRAVMLAERDGLAAKVDRVESWSLDLQQTQSCDERKAIIEKLVAAADKRALNALKKVRAAKCVEREASEAIAKLEAGK